MGKHAGGYVESVRGHLCSVDALPLLGPLALLGTGDERDLLESAAFDEMVHAFAHAGYVVFAHAAISGDLALDDERLALIQNAQKTVKGFLVVLQVSRDDAGWDDDGVQIESRGHFEGDAEVRGGVLARVEGNEVGNGYERVSCVFERVLQAHTYGVSIADRFVSHHETNAVPLHCASFPHL